MFHLSRSICSMSLRLATIRGETIIWTLQTLKVGHVTNTDIRHVAYPFPTVPLEYTLASLTSGLDPVWASIVMGLLYLLQLPLVVFLFSRRFCGFDDFKGAFVLLMAPLVVMWSARYIPQRLKIYRTIYYRRTCHYICTIVNS